VVAQNNTGARYLEFAPPPHLRGYVECLWVSKNSELPRTKIVFPDGCADIIVTESSVHIAGPMTTAEHVDLAPNAVVTGIRFHPGAAASALGASAAEMVDAAVPLGGVWGRDGDQATSSLNSAESARERLVLLTQTMTSRLSSLRPPDDISIAAGRKLARQPEIPLAEMAFDLGLSERQLRRRIQESVGYSPRTLARIMRFQRFLAAKDEKPGENLADLAVSTGYADQPHLTRECRALTGLTPAALLIAS
jgi:AraC-like DNA-binding protein